MGLCDLLWPDTGSFFTHSLGGKRPIGPPATLMIYTHTPINGGDVLVFKGTDSACSKGTTSKMVDISHV